MSTAGPCLPGWAPSLPRRGLNALRPLRAEDAIRRAHGKTQVRTGDATGRQVGEPSPSRASALPPDPPAVFLTQLLTLPPSCVTFRPPFRPLWGFSGCALLSDIAADEYTSFLSDQLILLVFLSDVASLSTQHSPFSGILSLGRLTRQVKQAASPRGCLVLLVARLPSLQGPRAVPGPARRLACRSAVRPAGFLPQEHPPALAGDACIWVYGSKPGDRLWEDYPPPTRCSQMRGLPSSPAPPRGEQITKGWAGPAPSPGLPVPVPGDRPRQPAAL